MSRRWPVLLATVLVAIVAACSKDDNKVTGPELVTVSGVVRNIDTGVPAKDVRVTLLGTSYADVKPTGTDGVYSLKVPKGSTLNLLTDDYDAGHNDAWFPLINVEGIPLVAGANMPDVPIHACPQTTCANPAGPGVSGSVATWDYYLQNLDQANGDRFVATSAATSGGIVVLLVGDCRNGTDYSDSMTAAIQNPDFPVGYVNLTGWSSGCAASELIYPANRGVTDASGLVFSFGNPATTADTLTCTVEDALSAPYRVPRSPFKVPVQHGTISLVWCNTVNGVEGRFKDYAWSCINAQVFCTP